jgi:hypothetical protein
MPDAPHDAHEETGALIRETSATVGAPPELRAAVASERLQQAPEQRRRSVRRPALALAVCAAAAVAVSLALLGGGSGTGASPSLAQASALALAPANQAAPAPDPRNPRFVARSVGTVRFPNYAYDAPWRVVGARSDRLAGRRATTVVYGKEGARVGYTIVDGPPLALPTSALPISYRHVDGHLVHRGDALAVVWERGGHTCIVASRDAGLRQLLRFTAWRA